MEKLEETGRVYGETDDGIATLVFENRARLNALSSDMAAEALDLLEGYTADPAVRVLILRGQGEKAFISGGDISKFEATRFDPETAAAGHQTTERLFERLAEFSRPVIAMIQGYCLGGGLGVALGADIRFGATTSQLGIPAALRGLAYTPAALERLVALVGPSVAKDMMFSGRRFPADEAQRVGLLNQVFPTDALETQTMDYARGIVANAPLSIRASKVCINECLKDQATRDYALIQQLRDEAANSADFKEATLAFMEKRKPRFSGR